MDDSNLNKKRFREENNYQILLIKKEQLEKKLNEQKRKIE